MPSLFLMRTLRTLICLITFAFALYSCDDNPHAIDVSGIEAEVDIQRFDQQLFEWTALSFRQEAPQVKSQFPGFYKHYFEDVINIGNAEDSALFNSIRLFINDPSIQQLHQSVQVKYPTLNQVEEQIESGWKHYKYYFPNTEVPNHLAFVGTLGTNVMVTDNEVGIGLDAYLGPKEEIYDLAQIPIFQRNKMIPERIPSDVIYAWMQTEFVLQNEQPTLLEVIVHEGRLLYALEACFPELADSLKIGYTAAQMQWANSFEKDVWTFFIDNEVLFKKDYQTVTKYVSEGPFTTDFAKESPARMGVFIGWQIVRSYMENHPDQDLKDLMALNDAQIILSESKYKP